MGKGKRVTVQMPQNLLEEVDGFVQHSNSDRNEFIQEATRLYLQKKKKQQIRERLRNGYLEMGDLNLSLADEGLRCEARTICFYEESLAKCE